MYDRSTYAHLRSTLQTKNQKRNHSIPLQKDLKREDRFRLPFLYLDKQEEKDDTENKERQDDRVRPGQLDASELKGEHHGQNHGGEDQGALEVYPAPFALFALGGGDDG